MRIEVTVRFYAELNAFLRPDRRQVAFVHRIGNHTSVKHLIEALGVPHTEVELILANGEPIDFAYFVRAGDRIAVYPRFTSIDVTSVGVVSPAPHAEPRFALDTHLGRLAAYLRMLGFDTLYRNDFVDEELARLAGEEQRVLLTRDRGLLKRSAVAHGYHVWATDPERQIEEVVRRFDLVDQIRPFRRCIRCNGCLESVAKDEIVDQLEPKTRRYFDEFRRCRDCGQIYWKGSHHERMRRLIQGVVGDAGAHHRGGGAGGPG